MKRNVLSILGVVIFAVLLIGGMTLSHRQPQPPTVHALVAASPSPLDSPTPPIVATLQNPLPSPSPSQLPVASTPAPAPAPAAIPTPALPAASPLPTDPSPDPSPSPVTVVAPSPIPSPSPLPPPPPPVCSWSVTVQTLISGGVWGDLGTWTGSAQTSSSPIFITGVEGWLQYTYQFSSACVGTATLLSYYELSGATIFNTPIGGTTANTIDANVPNNTQVQFRVTVQ